MAKSVGNLLGAWAFLIGVLLAIVVGLFGNLFTGEWIWWVLVLAGVLVGLFNVGVKETSTFLTAAVVLVIVSYMGQSALGVIDVLGRVLAALLVLFVPATVVVALKTVMAIARK